MNEFTARHFELLDRWKGHKLDGSDPEQKQAYEVLQEAYSVTEAWAHAVKERLFPSGKVKVVKKPTNQPRNSTLTTGLESIRTNTRRVT